MKLLLLAGLGALTVGVVSPAAQAAPPGANVATVVEHDASANGLVQDVRRRRYHRYYHYRPYRRRHRHRFYFNPYYYYSPYYYYDYRPYRYRRHWRYHY
jgi:hypothetical protein